MSETLQTAKEEVQQELDVLKPGYKLPKLELTEEDKNLYAESLATGNPFSHKFENGPLIKVAQDKQLAAYKHFGFWKCMDALRDRIELQTMWDSGKSKWKIW